MPQKRRSTKRTKVSALHASSLQHGAETQPNSDKSVDASSRVL
jgi:hypothetical protein